MNVAVAEVIISGIVRHQYDVDATKARHRREPGWVLAAQIFAYVEASKPVVVPNTIVLRPHTGVIRVTLFDCIEQRPIKNLLAIYAENDRILSDSRTACR